MLGAIRKGILAGLAGGAVFGVIMAIGGTLTMIAGIVGSSSPVIGFLIHLMISGVIGAGFGVLLGGYATTRSRALGGGLAYGALWWVLGPLILMPWMMGMGFAANLNAKGVGDMLPSLVGHLVYGGVLGFGYGRLPQG